MKRMLALFGSGCAVGWLLGLSASPVLAIVLTAIVGLVVTSVAVLSVMHHGGTVGSAEQLATLQKQATAASPYPLFMVLLGIAVAAPLGIVARTHEWFGASSLAAGSGANASTSGNADDGYRAGVLFTRSVPADECLRLRAYAGRLLLDEARNSSIGEVKLLAGVTEDLAAIERMVDIVCPASR